MPYFLGGKHVPQHSIRKHTPEGWFDSSVFLPGDIGEVLEELVGKTPRI